MIMKGYWLHGIYQPKMNACHYVLRGVGKHISQAHFADKSTKITEWMLV